MRASGSPDTSHDVGASHSSLLLPFVLTRRAPGPGKVPNAKLHLLPEAVAQRTLEAVRCTPLLGVSQSVSRCP